MHIPENIERWEEKEIDSGKIKLKSRLVIEFRPLYSVGNDFGAIAIVM